tara:strand:- start:697 stop:1167 length:471 start_codon:yes stop_codon:yes gene_type:complete
MKNPDTQNIQRQLLNEADALRRGEDTDPIAQQYMDIQTPQEAQQFFGSYAAYTPMFDGEAGAQIDLDVGAARMATTLFTDQGRFSASASAATDLRRGGTRATDFSGGLDMGKGVRASTSYDPQRNKFRDIRVKKGDFEASFDPSSKFAKLRFSKRF